MMDLSQASSYFDRTEAFDPLTGDLLFRCQLAPLKDTKRDAASAYRRILSVAPSVEIPTHRTANILGTTWIIGVGEVDGIGAVHRQNFVIAPASGTFRVSSLQQYLAGESSGETPAATYWSKDAKQISTSSEQPQMFDVFLPVDVPPQTVLWDEACAYLVASPRTAAAGLVCAYSLKLKQGREPGTVTSRRFSPSTGEFVTLASVQMSVLRVRWQSLFEYDDQADEKYQEGDVSIVLTAMALTTKDQITVSGVTYQVRAVDQLEGVQVAHCRKV